MSVPLEFTTAYVAENSTRDKQLYNDFLYCGEPYKSMFRNNPWLAPPDMRQPLPWGTGSYWDTTVARKHDDWKDVDLPTPTKDINELRRDLREWGLCLIEDGMSAAQCRTFRERLWAQAEGERRAGVDQPTPSGQYINTLINKGRCFAQCIEHDPEAVQAGPVIEQLLDETLGKGWICHSFLSNGSDPGGYPQALHMDQGPLLPFQTTEAPALVNTMFIPQDVNEHNGGTLIIPGSHKIMAKAGSGGEVGALPRPINLEAKAGSVMVFDGRVLHGTGVNRGKERRFVATMSNIKPWMRQQENWVMSVKPEILESASPKLLHRMGLQATTYGATVEGVGLGAAGKVGERWGNIQGFRRAQDAGAYLRVGELSGRSSKTELNANYTVKRVREEASRG